MNKIENKKVIRIYVKYRDQVKMSHRQQQHAKHAQHYRQVVQQL